MVDLIELEETKRVRVGNRPFSIAVSRDGHLFVVESGDDTVTVFDPELKKLTSLKVGDQPIDVQLSLNNRFVYVTAEKENRLFIFEILSP